MSKRAELINQLADKIEKELREAIIREPHPGYTQMDTLCYFCMEIKPRSECRLVVPNVDNLLEDFVACIDCIERKNIKVTDTERTLEFEARTIAIQRIKYGARGLKIAED